MEKYTTIAEALADLAQFVRYPKASIIVTNRVGYTKIALDLSAKPLLMLRAIAEDWSIEKIVQEVY